MPSEKTLDRVEKAIGKNMKAFGFELPAGAGKE